MIRAKIKWGAATAGLMACVGLTALVGHSLGEDKPDASNLTRPKEPKTRVYDSRIQMHRMDWTFEGDEVLYHRKTHSRPDLPPGPKDSPFPADSELSGRTQFVSPSPRGDDAIDEKKKNWILPPSPEGTTTDTQSPSPWDFLKLRPSDTPDVTSPYKPAETNTNLTSEGQDKKYREITDHLLMSEEDIRALADQSLEKKLRSQQQGEEGYRPVVSESSLGGGAASIGFGTSLLSRETDDESDSGGYGDLGANNGEGTASADGSPEQSLSERLGLGRSGEPLQSTRRSLGFADHAEEVDRESADSIDSTGWRGVFKGLGSNLQAVDPVGPAEVETSSYNRDSVPVSATFQPTRAPNSYREAYSSDVYAPAGPSRSADLVPDRSYMGTKFGPTEVDRFSFSEPTYQSEDFSVMGDGRERLRESTATYQANEADPFARFNSGGDSATGDREGQFRILLR